MLSSFLRRLIFAREFSAMDGRIEMLGAPKVMLPADILFELNNERIYSVCRNSAYSYMEKLKERKDTKDKDVLTFVKGIYESYGLGLLVIEGDGDKIRLKDYPENSEYIVSGILSGLLSSYCGKDMNIGHEELNEGIFL